MSKLPDKPAQTAQYTQTGEDIQVVVKFTTQTGLGLINSKMLENPFIFLTYFERFDQYMKQFRIIFCSPPKPVLLECVFILKLIICH